MNDRIRGPPVNDTRQVTRYYTTGAHRKEHGRLTTMVMTPIVFVKNAEDTISDWFPHQKLTEMLFGMESMKFANRRLYAKGTPCGKCYFVGCQRRVCTSMPLCHVHLESVLHVRIKRLPYGKSVLVAWNEHKSRNHVPVFVEGHNILVEDASTYPFFRDNKVTGYNVITMQSTNPAGEMPRHYDFVKVFQGYLKRAKPSSPPDIVNVEYKNRKLTALRDILHGEELCILENHQTPKITDLVTGQRKQAFLNLIGHCGLQYEVRAVNRRVNSSQMYHTFESSLPQ